MQQQRSSTAFSRALREGWHRWASPAGPLGEAENLHPPGTAQGEKGGSPASPCPGLPRGKRPQRCLPKASRGPAQGEAPPLRRGPPCGRHASCRLRLVAASAQESGGRLTVADLRRDGGGGGQEAFPRPMSPASAIRGRGRHPPEAAATGQGRGNSEQEGTVPGVRGVCLEMFEMVICVCIYCSISFVH